MRTLLSAVGRPSAKRRGGTFALICLVTLLAPEGAWAHDYWLVPHVLLSPSPVETPLSLFVGDDFVAEEEKEMSPERAARFEHLHGGARFDLLPTSTAGQRPITRVGPLAPGGHLFILDRTSTRIEIEAKKFEAYLDGEGLSAIVAERARRGESERPGREKYERFLKAFVQIGSTRDDTYRREVGQSLEILPATDPSRLAEGQTLAVAIRWNGAPLSGAYVERLSRTAAGDGVDRQAARTGLDGVVNVTVPGDGVHLLRLVHMVRCEGCPDADWRSYWASYTFASGPPDIPRAVIASPMLKPGPMWRSRGAQLAAAVLVLGALGLGLFLRRARARERRRTSPSPGS